MLTGKYMGEHFGFEVMQIGVVQFGNGKITSHGTLSLAEEFIGLLATSRP